MYYYNSPYLGMHFFWWIFWIFLWVSMFSYWTPVPRRTWRMQRDTPHSILQRRLASGDINEQDYERQKAILDRDVPTDSSRSVNATKAWSHPTSQVRP